MYTSSDGGQTWGLSSLPQKFWGSVACSADGLRMFAVSVFGELFTSTNSGSRWSTSSAPSAAWEIACSPDSMTLLAGGGNEGPNRSACVSTDGGVTWRTNLLSWRPQALAMSADGKQMRAGAYTGSLYTSTNFGITWEEAINNPNPWTWHSIATSADGTRIIAAARVHSADPSGFVYLSSDSGLTGITNSLPRKYWRGVACSADGSTLLAITDRNDTNGVPGEGSIYILKTTPEPRLNLTSVSNRVALSWITPSIDFRLQQSSDLRTQNWMTVTDAPSLNYTNLQSEVFLPKPASNTFYRLSAQ